jgi:ADP-ribose pyrophosphatase YjhB (NUDIX family)
MTEQPDIQLITNLVVLRPDNHVLFVRYHADDERWWLPGEDLEPYEHPDERARAILAGFEPLAVRSIAMTEVESFRGRRAWHVIFNYRVEADGDPGGEFPTAWFPADGLPRTMHGRWERERVSRVLAVAVESG